MPARNAPDPLDPPAGTPPLAVLGGTGVLLGGAITLAFLGVPGLASLADPWRRLWGVAALPGAIVLAWAGAMLLLRRGADPWALPWGRTVAAEVGMAAALALLAAASGRPDGGAGGVVGAALVATAAGAVGAAGAVLLWLALAIGAVAVLLGVGTGALAARLESLAATLGPAGQAGAAPRTPPATTAVNGPAAPAPGRAGRPASSRPAVPVPAPAVARPAETAPAPTAAVPAPPLKVTTYQPGVAARPARGPTRPAYLPGLDLLEDEGSAEWDEAGARDMANRIERTLAGFGVPVSVATIERGPTVTRFGLRPGTVARGGQPMRVKVAQVKALKDDLALALAVRTLRLEAPVPGRPLLGIEVPNPDGGPVRLRGLVALPEFTRRARAGGLVLALGRDVTGAAVLADLARLPHLLIAGTTGSGKSVCLHAVLASLLMQASPDQVRLIIVDPKRVELQRYQGLPHLVAPVVTDLAEAVGALRWAVAEMEGRYRHFEAARARDRAAYNERLKAGVAPLPAVVVVVDELADLMLSAPDEVEPLVARLAQLGRAAGIHLVVATQRPSTDVVTGLIKANFPARIAFAVASGTDSRVILDQVGAEALLGQGDLLFQSPDAPQPVRAQGVLVSEDEVGRLAAFWAASHWGHAPRTAPWDDLVPTLDPDEALYAQAVQLTQRHGTVSSSFLQRKLHVGYARARDLFDRLVDEGVVDAHGRAPGAEPGVGDGAGDDDMSWVDQEFSGP